MSLGCGGELDKANYCMLDPVKPKDDSLSQYVSEAGSKELFAIQC